MSLPFFNGAEETVGRAGRWFGVGLQAPPTLLSPSFPSSTSQVPRPCGPYPGTLAMRWLASPWDLGFGWAGANPLNRTLLHRYWGSDFSSYWQVQPITPTTISLHQLVKTPLECLKGEGPPGRGWCGVFLLFKDRWTSLFLRASVQLEVY